ncbi:hypothetical protein [Bacillus nakamurai]|nr:hypothetical protein [Bacillus nakamurai]
MPSTAKIWPFTNQQHGKLKGEKDPASSRHHLLIGSLGQYKQAR